jgi:hypothetical protein
MSTFAAKQFRGQTYTFEHLQPRRLDAELSPTPGELVVVPVTVQFGCHCFTEAFDKMTHSDEHRYVHLNELRAFDEERFQCSLKLPDIIDSMLGGKVYWSTESYTYVAQITLPTQEGALDYSLFFALTRNSDAVRPALNMFVKSAYLKGLAAPPNAESWRFRALIGLKSGVFEKKKKPKPRPKANKKK